MAIALDPQLEQDIEAQARTRGYSSPSGYLQDLIRQADSARPEIRQTKGWQLVEHLRGTATRPIPADEIMDETRSEI